MFAHTLDDFDGAGEVAITGDEDGCIVGVVVGEIEKVNGKGDVYSFFYVDTSGPGFKTTLNNGEVGFALYGVDEFLLFGVTLWISGLIGEGGVVVGAGEVTASDEFGNEKFKIHIYAVEIFLKAMEEVGAINKYGYTFSHGAALC